MKPLAILLMFVLISLSASAQTLDTLTAKRVFITTKIYRNGFKLSHGKILSLYKDTWQPKVKYKWGYYMNPVAPVVTVAGIGLAVVALKGKDATAIVKGNEVQYKIRSLPKLLIGIGLAGAGLCMIESSNELVQHSVDIYNAKLKNQKPAISFIQQINFGFTESNGVGLTLRF
ncbi:hypothetical protein [Emticicia sp. BO119]|uniref:hypothetical protein n=1 Tax=Emticicia sp. BO119 TaxID=2757768 RepID=UPI0015F045AB|nr:hypothetical protein [Emticicia sp. BO119]MBA4852594.1 hypothetical protein [Emticicia sp. BO119]